MSYEKIYKRHMYIKQKVKIVALLYVVNETFFKNEIFMQLEWRKFPFILYKNLIFGTWINFDKSMISPYLMNYMIASDLA